MVDLTPTSYTDIEGGQWLPWGAGVVSLTDLEPSRNRQCRIVNGIEVHSFMFPDGRRWDSITGFGNG